MDSGTKQNRSIPCVSGINLRISEDVIWVEIHERCCRVQRKAITDNISSSGLNLNIYYTQFKLLQPTELNLCTIVSLEKETKLMKTPCKLLYLYCRVHFIQIEDSTCTLSGLFWCIFEL